MSLNAALLAATSGLNAASRGAAVVADNIANSATEGFGPRRLALSSTVLGGAGVGVTVAGVQRQENAALTASLRAASADDSAARTLRDHWAGMEALVGAGDAPGGLSARVDALGTALAHAAAHSESTTRLDQVAAAARALTGTLARIETGITEARAAADRSIARDVEALNTGLRRVEALNAEITRQQIAGSDPNGLMDERARIIDGLAALVPLRVMPGDHGAVRLITDGGAVLLGSRAAEIGFDPAPGVAPGDDTASGVLSGLTVNGRAVDTGPRGPLAGGSLGVAFDIRDRYAPTMQAGLDRLAADLVARFADPATDPTLSMGAPGLFADPDPGAGIVGLAGRLHLNPLADPEAGGALWRLRSGLGAPVPGPVGDPARLDAMAQALDRPTALAPGMAAGGLAAHAADLGAEVGAALHRAEAQQTFTAAARAQLADARAAAGVDTDAELQTLLTIEAAYAANARVMRAVDDMLRRLMEI